MNSIVSAFRSDPSGTAPKQHGAVPMLELNDSNKIPMLAYGLGTANSKYASDDVIKATTTAIKAGFFHLDGAEMYGNETELGKAIAASKIPRSSLFVTTKLDNKPEYVGQVDAVFTQSLKRLNLEYVDLYLIHHPAMAGGDPSRLQSLWRELEAIHASGRAKSIGVSNFLAEDLEALLAGDPKVVPAINQIEFHPYYQRQAVITLCREKNIAVSAYAPLSPVIRVPGGPLHTSGLLPGLAKKYGVNEADVLLRWVIDQGIVAITTSSNEVRVNSYISNIPNFKLTPKEVETIAETGAEAFHRCFFQSNFKEGDTR
ncbi:NADP-dependent oxidoreductase domain-containing protein [Microdochium bolleyi]|uniref:NADP-dependent oxidoreductase domain-containing protein n=1 Tax=Microdochium bolleyi TaxID=196109 RepID=A0A136IY15_9PEZI|nr:NADP-dependent oxidoreductase domain-containing protein [Microdochium bolleyi]